ncbi:MAG: pilus assembly protein PilB, partial [Rubripirellula sp.]
MAPRRIGQILVDLGFLTDEQLEVVLEEQEQQPGALFGRIAEEMQLITDDQLIQALAEQMGMQTVSLEDF